MPRIAFEPRITFGNVLSAVSTLLVILAAVINLKLDVQAANSGVASLRAETAASISTISEKVKPLDDMTTRLSLVERGQISGKEARENFQQQIQKAVDKLSDQLDATRQQNAQMMAQLAAIAAQVGAPSPPAPKR